MNVIPASAAIPVTNYHLTNCMRGVANRCALANALRSVYPYSEIHVTAARIILLTQTATHLLQNDSTLQSWIHAFDNGQQLDPCTLHLNFITQEATIS